MGYKLRRELRDVLIVPGLLTPTERLVLLEIGESCNDDTRRGWPTLEWLVAACDLASTKKAGEIVTAIGRKWFDIRVQVGKDKNGRPVYAIKGQAVTYRIPLFGEIADRHGAENLPARTQATPPVSSPPVSGGVTHVTSPVSGEVTPPVSGGVNGLYPPQNRGAYSSKTPQSSSSSVGGERRSHLAAVPDAIPEEEELNEIRKTNGAAEALAGALGISTDEARKVVAERTPANVVSRQHWWRAVIAAGDAEQYRPLASKLEKLGPPRCTGFVDDGSRYCAKCSMPRNNTRFHRESA